MSADSPGLAEVAATIWAERLVPVIRTATEAEARDRIALCRDAGLGVIELTTTTPGWDAVLAAGAADPGNAGILFGVGTISTVEQAVQAVACGAAFVVSPFLVPKVRASLGGRAVLIEAGSTPTEIATAAASSPLVKLFPASSAGPAHLRAIGDVMPGLAIMPTGGIRVQDAVSWIDAGAIAVGMGNSLFELPASGIAALKRQLLERGSGVPHFSVSVWPPASGGC